MAGQLLGQFTDGTLQLSTDAPTVSMVDTADLSLSLAFPVALIVPLAFPASQLGHP